MLPVTATSSHAAYSLQLVSAVTSFLRCFLLFSIRLSVDTFVTFCPVAFSAFCWFACFLSLTALRRSRSAWRHQIDS